MKRVGICAKVVSPEAIEFSREIATELIARNVEVTLDEATHAGLQVPGARRTTKPELGQNSDLIITFGGDGTLLSVARHAPSSVPIVGVNMGTLGFLTEIRVEEFRSVLEDVLAGRFRAEERVAFDVTVESNGVPQVYRVLNDAVINKSALARIIEMRVSVGEEFVSTFRADGLIVSTPTGSTAYNLSAGGPIIYPTMNAVVLTPICPHMLSNRPIVLPDTLPIEIEVETPNQEVFVTLDGQEGVPLVEHQRVVVQKSLQPVLLVLSPSKNYFDVLRSKLKWGESADD
jgi:NAD+ kinase